VVLMLCAPGCYCHVAEMLKDVTGQPGRGDVASTLFLHHGPSAVSALRAQFREGMRATPTAAPTPTELQRV
jgi:hypothetical protein